MAKFYKKLKIFLFLPKTIISKMVVNARENKE